ARDADLLRAGAVAAVTDALALRRRFTRDRLARADEVLVRRAAAAVAVAVGVGARARARGTRAAVVADARALAGVTVADRAFLVGLARDAGELREVGRQAAVDHVLDLLRVLRRHQRDRRRRRLVVDEMLRRRALVLALTAGGALGALRRG